MCYFYFCYQEYGYGGTGNWYYYYTYYVSVPIYQNLPDYSGFSQEALSFAGAAVGETVATAGSRVIAKALEIVIVLILGEDADVLLSDPNWPVEDVGEDIGMDQNKAEVLIIILNEICAIAGKDRCIEEVEEAVIATGTDGGYIDPDELEHNKMDIDALGRWIKILATAETARSKRSDYRHCTYRKQKPSLVYYGRTSGPESESCTALVADRDQRHVELNKGGFAPADLDQDLGVGTGAYSRARGREQQLIDHHVYDADFPDQPLTSSSHGIQSPYVRNRIRGVARDNPLGCGYWLASTAYSGYAGPYTGSRLPVVCDTIPPFPP